MNRQWLKKPRTWLLIALGIAVVWWGLHKLDPTSSAIFTSNSPDGKYRCAVFCKGGFGGFGNPTYEAGLFEAHWPHWELPGQRAEWNYDSVSSHDFKATWRADGADINFCTGYGDSRATASGRVINGRQAWTHRDEPREPATSTAPASQ